MFDTLLKYFKYGTESDAINSVQMNYERSQTVCVTLMSSWQRTDLVFQPIRCLWHYQNMPY